MLNLYGSWRLLAFAGEPTGARAVSDTLKSDKHALFSFTHQSYELLMKITLWMTLQLYLCQFQEGERVQRKLGINKIIRNRWKIFTRGI